MKHQGYPFIITISKLEATQVITLKPLVFVFPPVYNQHVSNNCFSRYSFCYRRLCRRRTMSLIVLISGAIPLKPITRSCRPRD